MHFSFENRSSIFFPFFFDFQIVNERKGRQIGGRGCFSNLKIDHKLILRRLNHHKIRFDLHKHCRAAGIRFYVRKDCRVAAIRFYLHKDCCASGIRFHQLKQFFTYFFIVSISNSKIDHWPILTADVRRYWHHITISYSQIGHRSIFNAMIVRTYVALA